ncbi:hypothetical protein FUA48_12300 [Flavobacterium alkalisoli]|uniref:Uncharacterized protein n=1 Tax=Flavobacterium alkalisoli TaxID=2602769 RepID=A0A5B9FTJ5_9FLAO|nr:hypothetical protein [Flavobacterium alkalisoli]QEE50330.1 hypothetical protein FUA48_12300 [Flavobacterium alkalisoli]
MEKLDLNKIEEITNKATKGPWKSFREGRDHTSGSSFIMTGVDGERGYDIELDMMREEDQDFIAMARNVIPELIDEVKRLQDILKSNSIKFW